MNNNHPTFYKHLTVILAALLTTVVVALIALVLLLSSPSDTPSDGTTPSTPIASTPSGQSSQTTTPPVTTPSTSTSTSTGGSTTTTTPKTQTTTSKEPITNPPPVTNDPPIVEPPIVIEPITGSVYGDSLASLKLYAEWNTVSYDPETGSHTLKLDFYCESFSLQRGSRTGNYIIINGERVEFTTEAINIPSGSPKVRTLLYSTEYVVEKDDPTARFPVHIDFAWHNWGSYSGEYAEWLTLVADFEV